MHTITEYNYKSEERWNIGLSCDLSVKVLNMSLFQQQW